MSILSVDTIQPIGSGTTITLNAAKTVVGTGITFESNGQATYAGIVTATSFSGSGANLTSLPAANLTGTLPAISGANLTSLPAQATIANNADNRVITGGSGVNLNGESTLTYDDPTLEINTGSSYGVLKLDGSAGGLIEFKDDGTRKWELYGATNFSFYDRANLKYGLILKPAGDVEIPDGNLVIGTSGHGIDFSATASNGTSELLDDYEEGSWTPAAKNAGSFTSPTGRYVKIGHQVTVWGYIPTITDITSTSNFEISGLPYTATSSNHTEFVGPVMMRFQSVTNQNGATFTTYQASGWNYLRIYASRDDGNNYEVAKHEDWNFTSAGIRFCHSYTV